MNNKSHRNNLLKRIVFAFAISAVLTVSLLILPSVQISIVQALCVSGGVLVLLIGISYLDLRVHGKQIGKPVKKPGFDYATHYFRAFAILCVMACHYYSFAGYHKLNQAILTAATHYFLFISGYLCQYLYSRKPEAPVKYYVKKIRNVIVPYFVFTVIFSAAPFVSEIAHGEFSGVLFLKTTMHNLLWGSSQFQYWYIPFIVSLFIVSPFVCRIRNSIILTMLALFFIVSILIPIRQYPFTYYWPGVLYLYTYFVPYYILGFVYARYKDLLDEFLDRHIVIVGSLSVALILILLFGEYTKVQFAPSDLVVSFQRCAMIGVMLWLFRRIREGLRILDLIAEYSFALFFIHMHIFIKAISAFSLIRVNFIAATLVFIVLVLILMFACYCIKRCLGGFSRMIIGS